MVRILIAAPLVERIEKRVAKSEFKSVSAYAVAILEQILEQMDSKK